MAQKAKGVQLKKISPWKVLLFGVVTFGVYSLVWTSRRYREATASTAKSSHWALPVGILVGGFVIMTVVSVVLSLLVGDAHAAATAMLCGTYGGTLLVAGALTWWMAWHVVVLNRHSKAVIPLWAVVVMAFCMAPILSAYVQYRINDKRARVSFALPTAIAAVMGSIGIVIAVASVDMQIASFERDITSFREDMKQIEQLSGEYKTCTDKLATDYPQESLTEENYDQYTAAYNVCDEIYQKIQKI